MYLTFNWVVFVTEDDFAKFSHLHLAIKTSPFLARCLKIKKREKQNKKEKKQKIINPIEAQKNQENCHA